MYEKIYGPITSAGLLYRAGRIVGVAVVLLVVGLELLYLIGRSSPARRRHGTYVVLWMIGGWLAAGLASLPFLDGV